MQHQASQHQHAALGSPRQERESVVALFLVHMFPIGHLPVASDRPARQLPAPEPEPGAPAVGRFEPHDHPDSDVIEPDQAIDLLRQGARQPAPPPVAVLPCPPAEVRDGYDPLGGMHERDWDARFLAADTAADPPASADTPASPDITANADADADADPDTAVDTDTAAPAAGAASSAGSSDSPGDDTAGGGPVAADTPGYVWPPADEFPEGCSAEGEPELLAVGTVLDRFGTAHGRVFAPAGTPFPRRSLPPSDLDAGYRRYRVLREVPMWRGVSAGWFGQPGGGGRYRAGYSAAELVTLGYLADATFESVDPQAAATDTGDSDGSGAGTVRAVLDGPDAPDGADHPREATAADGAAADGAAAETAAGTAEVGGSGAGAEADRNPKEDVT